VTAAHFSSRLCLVLARQTFSHLALLVYSLPEDLFRFSISLVFDFLHAHGAGVLPLSPWRNFRFFVFIL